MSIASTGSTLLAITLLLPYSLAQNPPSFTRSFSPLFPTGSFTGSFSFSFPPPTRTSVPVYGQGPSSPYVATSTIISLCIGVAAFGVAATILLCLFRVCIRRQTLRDELVWREGMGRWEVGEKPEMWEVDGVEDEEVIHPLAINRPSYYSSDIRKRAVYHPVSVSMGVTVLISLPTPTAPGPEDFPELVFGLASIVPTPSKASSMSTSDGERNDSQSVWRELERVLSDKDSGECRKDGAVVQHLEYEDSRREALRRWDTV
ncbi:hypothetical protein IAT38_004304 [Cryptococcus sp. DSM 104549]